MRGEGFSFGFSRLRISTSRKISRRTQDATRLWIRRRMRPVFFSHNFFIFFFTYTYHIWAQYILLPRYDFCFKDTQQTFSVPRIPDNSAEINHCKRNIYVQTLYFSFYFYGTRTRCILFFILSPAARIYKYCNMLSPRHIRYAYLLILIIRVTIEQ